MKLCLAISDLNEKYGLKQNIMYMYVFIHQRYYINCIAKTTKQRYGLIPLIGENSLHAIF